MLHELVGMGLFAGYVNWDEGMLYSRQASELRQLSQCENCGGQLELAGKGVIRCPYCGTEYFL
jgi:tRNA(Ile2) C34 agmatinyltransferase TiaS